MVKGIQDRTFRFACRIVKLQALAKRRNSLTPVIPSRETARWRRRGVDDTPLTRPSATLSPLRGGRDSRSSVLLPSTRGEGARRADEGCVIRSVSEGPGRVGGTRPRPRIPPALQVPRSTLGMTVSIVRLQLIEVTRFFHGTQGDECR